LREVFATAYDIEPEKVLALASLIQKYLDQSLSLPLHLRMPTLSQLSSLMQLAWRAGLKSVGPVITAHGLVRERSREGFARD
jgi:ribonucleoside-diphosphate reductase alpha chain